MRPGWAPGVLVGRDEEIARLRELVDQLTAGRGRVVWVEGEPGIGKSVLLAAGLGGASGLGCRVFWAAADEVGGRFPLQVLLDGLEIGPRSADPARAEIAGLLWGRDGSGLVTPADVVAAAAEQLVVFLDRSCAAEPTVLVCDDLQWADEVSLQVWARLCRLVEQLPLLLVAALRPVPERREMALLRQGVAGRDAVTLRLGALAPAQVQALVAHLVGAEPGPGLRAQAAQAGGNPLYVRELVDALRREQRLVVRAGVAGVTDGDAAWEASGPRSLAAAIANRLGFLTEPTAGVLRMAALLGSEFSVWHLGVLTGRAATELVAVVDEAVAAGVLAEAGDRLAFRHGLIRQALYQGTPSGLRSALHRQAAQALAGAGAPAERVAEQLLAAPDADDAWVVDWLAEAASGLAYRAPQIAVQLLGRVHRVAPVGDRRRELLAVGLVTGLFLLGRYEEVVQLAAPALASAQDPAVAGQLAWTLASALRRMARYEQALAVTGPALADRTLSEGWTARMRALQSGILLADGRHEQAEATARQAQAEGQQAGDRIAIAHALQVQHMTLTQHRPDPAAVLDLIDRALAVLGHDPEATDLRLLLLGNRVPALCDLGRAAEADRPLGEALALAERAGAPTRLARLRVQAADLYLFVGRWDEALAELVEAADPLRPEPSHCLWLHGIGALIAAHRDDRAAHSQHLNAVKGLSITDGAMRYYADYLRMARAVAAERDGRPETALAPDPETGLGFPGADPPEEPVWLPHLVRLALAAGDQARAHAATQASAAAAASQMAMGATGAAAEHCRGLLTADPTPLLAAADTYAKCGYSMFRAHALEDAAVLLAGRGQTQTARSAYTDALDIYTTLGAEWDTRRADARLRPLGLRRGARGPRRRPTTGWQALTASELKIATLVATGRSNPDIAAELFLSRNTVQTHVSNILAKLDAHSRIEIAREAIRHTDSTPD